VNLDAGGASLVIPTQLTPDWAKVEHEIEAGVSAPPRWERELGAASLVAEGQDAETGPGLYADAAEALAAAGLRPLGASAAAARLSFLLPEAGLDAAVRALHQRFVGPREG
jgi:aspartokinase